MANSECLKQAGQSIAHNAILAKKHFPKQKPVPYVDIIYSEALRKSIGIALRTLSPGMFRIGRTESYPSNLTLTRVR